MKFYYAQILWIVYHYLVVILSTRYVFIVKMYWYNLKQYKSLKYQTIAVWNVKHDSRTKISLYYSLMLFKMSIGMPLECTKELEQNENADQRSHILTRFLQQNILTHIPIIRSLDIWFFKGALSWNRRPWYLSLNLNDIKLIVLANESLYSLRLCTHSHSGMYIA